MGLTHAIVFFLAVLVYAPSRHCGVVFDDHLAIEQNADILEPSAARWLQLWKNDFWGREMWSENSHTSYRPLTIISFRIEALIYGKIHAANMHMLNVIIHAFVSSTVVTVASIVLCSKDNLSPFLAGVLFAVHPVHVEAVTGLVGRAELLCAFFMLKAYIALHQGEFWFSIFLCSCACLCKETGITFHGIVLAHLFVQSIVRWRNLVSRAEADTNFEAAVVVKRGGIAVAHAAVYLGLRSWLIQGSSEEGDMEMEIGLGSSQLIRKTENPYQALPPGLNKVLSLQILFVENARLLLYPKVLSAEYSFNCIPMVDGIDDPRLIYAFFLWMAALLMLGIAAKNLFQNGDAAFTLSLAWLALPFVPASHVIVTIGTLIAERLLYIPSIGFCIVAAHVVAKLSEKYGSQLPKAGITVVVAWMTLRTSMRIPDWRSDDSLFFAAIDACPNSAKLNSQIAKIYLGRGNLSLAREYLDRASAIHPDWCDLDYIYGMLALSEGDYEEVVDRYIKSLPCIYTNKAAHRALEQIFIARKEVLDQAEQGQDDDPALYFDMGRVHETIQRYAEALENYRTAAFGAQSRGQAKMALKVVRRALRMASVLQEDGEKAGKEVDLRSYECMFTYVQAWAMEREGMLEDSLELYEAAMDCDQTKNAAISAAVQLLQRLLQRNGQTQEMIKAYADVLSRVVDDQLDLHADIQGGAQPISEVQLQYVTEAVRYYELYALEAEPVARESVNRKVQALRRIISASQQ